MKKPIIAISGIKDGNMGFNFGDPAEAEANRRKFLERLGISGDTVFYMDPEHGAEIAEVTAEMEEKFPLADGLFTVDKGVALAFAVADCIPIFFWNKSVIALVHAGRIGVLRELPFKMRLLLKHKGLVGSNNPIEIRIGHHIGHCCYQFPKQVYWDWGYKFADVAPKNGEKFAVSLYKRLERSLIHAHQAIHPINGMCCTCCAKDRKGNFKFFSHVRSKRNPEGNPEGRNLAVIMRP